MPMCCPCAYLRYEVLHCCLSSGHPCRLHFRQSYPSVVVSAAAGCQASVCPWRRSTTWVAFSDATN
jgi:hypothetical protein